MTLPTPLFALDADQVNAAHSPTTTYESAKPEAFVTKLQILLDRAHFSPGQIDGKEGGNVDKTLKAFAEAHGKRWEGRREPDLWQALTGSAPANLFINYTTTDADLRGPFLQQLSARMEEMNNLPGLYYLSAKQELAERFHVSEQVLAALNPEAKFEQAGETIIVPNVAGNRLQKKVAHIVVDKSAQTVAAFDPKIGSSHFSQQRSGVTRSPPRRGD